MKLMGIVYAKIELINADNLALARKNQPGQDEVKHAIVNMLADIRAYIIRTVLY